MRRDASACERARRSSTSPTTAPNAGARRARRVCHDASERDERRYRAPPAAAPGDQAGQRLVAATRVERRSSRRRPATIGASPATTIDSSAGRPSTASDTTTSRAPAAASGTGTRTTTGDAPRSPQRSRDRHQAGRAARVRRSITDDIAARGRGRKKHVRRAGPPARRETGGGGQRHRSTLSATHVVARTARRRRSRRSRRQPHDGAIATCPARGVTRRDHTAPRADRPRPTRRDSDLRSRSHAACRCVGDRVARIACDGTERRCVSR